MAWNEEGEPIPRDPKPGHIVKTEIENIAGLAVHTIQKDYGIVGLDHLIQLLQSLRKQMVSDANKERTWEPK